jgi:hypothetical protein
MNWRMAEHSKPMPCGTIGVQSRAGEPCRFTIPGRSSGTRTRDPGFRKTVLFQLSYRTGTVGWAKVRNLRTIHNRDLCARIVPTITRGPRGQEQTSVRSLRKLDCVAHGQTCNNVQIILRAPLPTLALINQARVQCPSRGNRARSRAGNSAEMPALRRGDRARSARTARAAASCSCDCPS